MITPKNLSRQLRRQYIRGYIPAALAADEDKSWALGTIPYTAAIKAVRLIPQAAITGADTNSSTVEVYHGSTKAASIAFTAGTDATALTALAMTLVAAGLSVAADDVITFKRDKVGNGLALPEFLVEVEYEITDQLNKK